MCCWYGHQVHLIWQLYNVLCRYVKGLVYKPTLPIRLEEPSSELLRPLEMLRRAYYNVFSRVTSNDMAWCAYWTFGNLCEICHKKIYLLKYLARILINTSFIGQHEVCFISLAWDNELIRYSYFKLMLILGRHPVYKLTI